MDLAEDLARAHGIQAVVDVREECCDDAEVLRGHGMELLHLPTQDMHGVSLHMLDEGVSWVVSRLRRGDRVLIHCEHGVGRSALLATCVLVHLGLSPLEALRLARAKRPVISFSLLQQQRFAEWCERHRERAAARWPTPPLADIQRIVWG